MSESLFDIDMSDIERFQYALANDEQLENLMIKITHYCAKKLLDYLQIKTPVVTGQLRSGWGGENLACKVHSVTGGYMVHFTNAVEYAKWVNDGHLVRNKSNSPYFTVKHRTVEYYQGTMSPYYVYGHFFVEKAIFEMEDGNFEIDAIASRFLDQWWDWCLS